MAIQRGTISKKIRDALTADSAPSSTTITDATATGRALLTAASAAAARAVTGAAPALVAAPSTATSAGTTGQIAFDATHIYVAVNTNVWVRATLATF